MSSARSHKRRHSAAFHESEPVDEINDHDMDGSGSGDESDDTDGLSLEDQEKIYRTVREEHIDSLEQLSHTNNRKMSLMKEVDDYERDCSQKLQEAMRNYYLSRRRRLQATSDPDQDATHVAPGNSRASLPKIGSLMEDRVRASEEKINLAQTMQETIERQIRLLDNVIAEQETVVDSGSSVGTVLPPISMPEKWKNRTAHTAVSPMTDDDGPDHSPDPVAPGGASLKIKVPRQVRGAKGQVLLPPEGVVDAPPRVFPLPPPAADEDKYCKCQQISYGEMIACDNQSCKIEWFHIACVGLSEAPTAQKWYCDDCRKGRGAVPGVRKPNKKKRKKGDDAWS